MSSRYSQLHNNSNSFKYALGIDNRKTPINSIVYNGSNGNAINLNDNFPPINSNFVINSSKRSLSESPDEKNSIDYNNSINSTKKTLKNNNANLFASEIKVNNLEAKILVLEQNINYLKNQIKENNINNQLISNKYTIDITNENNKTERLEKLLNLIKDQNSLDKNQIYKKFDNIEDVINKEEKLKLDQRNRDIDMYNKMISSLTDKITETVKLEIDARFNADLENKNLTQNVTRLFMKEIEDLKLQFNNLSKDIYNISDQANKECANRTKALSKYLDLQLDGTVDGNIQTFNALKNYVVKLSEQLKENMKNQDNFNNVIDTKLSKHESLNVNNKEEVIEIIKFSENRLISKLKEFKCFTSETIESNFKYLNNKLNEYSKKAEHNNNLILNNQKDNNTIIINKINELKSLQINQFTAFSDDLEHVVKPGLMNCEKVINSSIDNINSIKKQISYDIADITNKLEIKEVNDKIIRNLEYNDIMSTINKLRNETVDLGLNMNYDIGYISNNIKSNYMNLYERSNLIVKQINRMAESNINMFESIEESLESNVKTLKDNQDLIQISNVMSDILTQIDKMIINEDILNLKHFDSYLHNKTNDLQDVMIKFSKIRDQDILNNNVECIMNKMLEEFDKSDHMNQLSNNFKEVYSTIDSVEDNVIKKFKELDDNDYRIEKTINNKITQINDVLKYKKNIETEEELLQIKNEVKARKNLEELHDRLIKENNNLIKILETKTLNEYIITKLEFKNIYENFEKIDIKLVNYDDNSEAYKIKFRTYDNKFTKVDRTILEIYNYIDKEVIIKVINDNILNNISFNLIQEEIERYIDIVLDEERGLNRFNTAFENKSKDLIQKFESLAKECNENSLSKYNETLEKTESKIEKALEKVKKDNVDMWTHSISIQNKITNPEEVRKIIQSIPPVIIDKELSLKKIYELEHESNPKKNKPTLIKAKGKIDNLINQANNKSDVYLDNNWKNKDNNIKEILPSKVGNINNKKSEEKRNLEKAEKKTKPSNTNVYN